MAWSTARSVFVGMFADFLAFKCQFWLQRAVAHPPFRTGFGPKGNALSGARGCGLEVAGTHPGRVERMQKHECTQNIICMYRHAY